MMRVGVWCAVSSRPQAKEEKTSLADQEKAGREFADALDAQVERVYRVPGLLVHCPASNTICVICNRPAFMECRNLRSR